MYIDDMLVKSLLTEKYLFDLSEMLQTSRKYKMKLNLRKCAFGVFAEKFLRLMVSQRGIEANPEKVRALIEMQPLKNTKEVQ